MNVYVIKGETDRCCKHLGVIQPNKTKTTKFRTPVDFEDISGFICSAPQRITHDTHSFFVPFGKVDPR